MRKIAPGAPGDVEVARQPGKLKVLADLKVLLVLSDSLNHLDDLNHPVLLVIPDNKDLPVKMFLLELPELMASSVFPDPLDL